jgi:polyphosphate:AMP phosphotransferase
MFEALETGKHLPQGDFKARREALRPALLREQFALTERPNAVLVLLAGLEGAGKGAVAHRLNEWMDPRLIETHALWQHSDEEESRPHYWRFWRRLPPRGRTAIMLGHWYRQPFHQLLDGAIDDASFETQVREATEFERMLCADGTLIIKIWLHVSRDMQRRQLAEEAPRQQQNPRVPGDPDAWWHRHPLALVHAERLLRLSDGSHAPWHLVEANERNYRDIAVATTVLEALQTHRAAAGRHKGTHPGKGDSNGGQAGKATAQPTLLDRVDLSQQVPRKDYKPELARLQARLQDLAWEAHHARRSLVAVFEGWDAAGKGSAIRRVTAAVDPRLYKLVQFAAPSDEESAHHYLWRFWRKLQRDGTATIFDRSWYGRVLVERVEGLTPEPVWRRAYSEINQFERQLAEHGCLVAKFWLHISKDEQLRRFRDREKKPHKQHKLSDEDWRNRKRWEAYENAVEEMVANTSLTDAPWHLIAGNDKKFARLEILRILCALFERGRAQDPGVLSASGEA